MKGCDLSSVILITFLVFVIFFLSIGAYAVKRSLNTDEDYLLGGRSFGTIFVALSAGATGNSGFIMLGAVGMGYTMGISGILLGLAWFLGDITYWSIFPGKINRVSTARNTYTVPELLGSSVKNNQNKHNSVRAIAGIITIIFVGAYLAAQFSAAAKTLNVFFDLSHTVGIILSAIAILLYCTKGGIRASIWTDFVQAIIMIAITTSMLGVAYIAAGGYNEIVAGLNSISPELTKITSGFTAWTLIAYILGYAFAGFGFGLSQPHVLVRIMAGRSEEEVRKARWTYVLFIQLTWICMVLFGVIARLLVPEIADPEQALPTYAMLNFSPLFVGLVLAGIFSAIASTADSQLLVCSSSFAVDIAPNFYERMKSRFGIRYQQVVTVLVGILGVIAASFSTLNVLNLVIFAFSALACSVGPAVVIVSLNRPTSALALNSCMLSGCALAIIWRLLGYNEALNESLPGFIFAIIVHEFVRKVFKKQE
jgi:sodium/proline symporter